MLDLREVVEVEVAAVVEGLAAGRECQTSSLLKMMGQS